MTFVAVAPPGLRTAIRQHQLIAFFALAYLFSWGYWIPVAIFDKGLSHFPGLLGPMLAALVMSSIVDGRRGLRELGRRMVHWRVAPRWYAAALVPLAAAALVLLGLRLADGGWPSAAELSTMPGLPEFGWLGVIAVVVFVNGYGEETGWRGFAWQRLRQRHGLGRAALLLAVPWAAWHLPTFWLDTGLQEISLLVLPGFFIGLAAGAVVLGWLYERSGASLPVVVLFHVALNLASATKGTEGLPAVAASFVVIFWAVSILRADHDQRDQWAQGKRPSATD